LLALSDADIETMGGEEVFKQLGVDLFTLRNQARLEAINA
jgi:D-lyxose ketol-isomerase